MIRNLEILGSKDLKIKSASTLDLAIRLLEGGIVECDGQFVKAIQVLDPYAPCFECAMFCTCSLKFRELCTEMNHMSNIIRCLALASDNH